MMLLYSMFNSVKDCLLVMVNVLEAAMGGVFALYFTGTHFSISGAVGFVSVFGVAVQDGVLLVTYCNQMRARGYSVWETCLRGPELRVRPVVMTSLTAALGLLPAALATSIGSQAQKPLAIVVVGAMLCTLFLTRYMMPILYSYFPARAVMCDGDDQHLVEGTNYSARLHARFSRRIIDRVAEKSHGCDFRIGLGLSDGGRCLMRRPSSMAVARRFDRVRRRPASIDLTELAIQLSEPGDAPRRDGSPASRRGACSAAHRSRSRILDPAPDRSRGRAIEGARRGR